VTPNPGSPEALSLGCTCPVIDNSRGLGSPWAPPTYAYYWVDDGCPVHRPPAPCPDCGHVATKHAGFHLSEPCPCRPLDTAAHDDASST
jgi:hypothetical protein